MERTLQDLQDLISQGIDDIHAIVGTIFTKPNDERLGLIEWMVNNLLLPQQNSGAGCVPQSVVLDLFSLVVSKDGQDCQWQHIKEFTLKVKDNREMFLRFLMQMIQESSDDYFQPVSVLQFLSWLVCQPEVPIQVLEMMLSYMEKVEEVETEVLEEAFQALRSSNSMVHYNFGPTSSLVVSFLIHEERPRIRSMFRSLLVQVKPTDYRSFDAIVLLTIFHCHFDATNELLNVLYTDCITPATTSATTSENTNGETDMQQDQDANSDSENSHALKRYILPLVISTLTKLKEEANVSSSKYSFLINASIQIAIRLLQSPIRYPNYPPLEFISSNVPEKLPMQMAMEATKIYIMDLFDLLPKQSKEQMIMMILSHADEADNSGHKGNDMEGKQSSVSEEEDDFMNRFPVNIREMFSGKNTSQSTAARVEKRHWHDVQTSSLIVLIELIRRYQFVTGMEKIRQRLEQYAVCMWYEESDQDGCCMDTGDKGEIIDLYCNAYVEYIEVSSNNFSGIVIADAADFVKRLLLSFWDVDGEKWSSMVGRDSSIVVGMILARYLIQSVNISHQDRSQISDLITRILMSPNEISGSHHVNAVIGYWGLIFYCSLCSECAPLVCFPHQKEIYLMKLDQQVKRSFTLPVNEVYDRIKILILVRLELIQLESAFVSKDRMSYLAYSTPPKCFKSRHRLKEQRVFCLGSLVSKFGNQLSMCQIREWFTFLNSLTGVYLRAGSFLAVAKWNPELWLLACTELLSNTGSDEKGLSLYYRLGVGKGWPETMNLRAFKHVPVRVMLQNVYTYVLAIAMHRAVLIHVIDYYDNRTAESDSTSPELIRFQLAKIYDLSFRFRRSIECILEATDDLSTCNHANELLAFMSNIFCRPSFIPLAVTWDILRSLDNPTDIRHFDEVMKTVSSKKISFSTSIDMELEGLLQHLLLECSVLLHIITAQGFYERWWEKTYTAISNLTYHQSVGNSFTSVEIIELFSSLKFKIFWLPICRMFNSSGSFLSGLTILDDPLILRSIADNARVSIVLSIDFIQQAVFKMPEVEKQVCVNRLRNIGEVTVSERKGLRSSQGGFVYEMIKYSLICEDPVLSSHVLDFVFLFTEGDSCLDEWLHNVTWKYLLQYSGSDSIVAYDSLFFFPLPRPLVTCIELGLDVNVSMITAPNRCLINLIRGLKKCFRMNSRYTTLYYSLVAHWSHTVYKSRIFNLCSDFHELVTAMKVILINGESSKCAAGLHPFKGVRSLKNDVKIEGLDKYSIPSFFDLIILLIVATLAIIHRANIAPQGERLLDNLSINQKPPTEASATFVAVIEVFGSLMSLYGRTFEHFSKASVQSAINACQHTIKLCEDEVNVCALAESSRRLQPRKRSSVTSPLQTLVDGIRSNCYVSIKMLCDSFRCKNDLKRESLIISLFEKNEKLSDMLFATESSCNLKPSSLMALPSSNEFKRSKIAWIKTSDKVVDERSLPSMVVKSVNDTWSGNDDDSFEASGDWGLHEET